MGGAHRAVRCHDLDVTGVRDEVVARQHLTGVADADARSGRRTLLSDDPDRDDRRSDTPRHGRDRFRGAPGTGRPIRGARGAALVEDARRREHGHGQQRTDGPRAERCEHRAQDGRRRARAGTGGRFREGRELARVPPDPIHGMGRTTEGRIGLVVAGSTVVHGGSVTTHPSEVAAPRKGPPARPFLQWRRDLVPSGPRRA